MGHDLVNENEKLFNLTAKLTGSPNSLKCPKRNTVCLYYDASMRFRESRALCISGATSTRRPRRSGPSGKSARGANGRNASAENARRPSKM